MPARRPQSWWKKSRGATLAFVAAMLGVAASGAALAPMSVPEVFGAPLWQFLCAVCLPFALAAALHGFGEWQEVTDRRYGVYEEE